MNNEVSDEVRSFDFSEDLRSEGLVALDVGLLGRPHSSTPYVQSGRCKDLYKLSLVLAVKSDFGPTSTCVHSKLSKSSIKLSVFQLLYQSSINKVFLDIGSSLNRIRVRGKFTVWPA